MRIGLFLASFGEMSSVLLSAVPPNVKFLGHVRRKREQKLSCLTSTLSQCQTRQFPLTVTIDGNLSHANVISVNRNRRLPSVDRHRLEQNTVYLRYKLQEAESDITTTFIYIINPWRTTNKSNILLHKRCGNLRT